MGNYFTPETAADLETEVLANYANRFPGKALSTEDFLGKLSRAEAQALWNAQLRMQRVSLDSIPNESTSYDMLANWATAIGLPDGNGGYGPKVATAATGGVVVAGGTVGSTVGIGTALVASDGVTQFSAVATVTVAALSAWQAGHAYTAGDLVKNSGNVYYCTTTGTSAGAGSGPTTTASDITDNTAHWFYAFAGANAVAVSVNATTAGAAGNLGVGSALTFVSPPAGVSTSTPVAVATSGGSDGEFAPAAANSYNKTGQQALLVRVLDRLQNPPKSITASDLRQTVEGVSGVSRAYVYERHEGTGTALVIFVQSANGLDTDGGASRIPGSTTDEQAALDAIRPVGAETYTAAVPGASGSHDLVIKATPITKYAWNWTDAYSGTITAYSAGTPSITLSDALPAAVQTLITAGTVDFQIKAANSVIPVIVTVAKNGYNAGTQVCTLTAAAPVTLLNGDAVFPSSAAVLPIARAVRNYVNTLGPSLVSGYAPPVTDTWSDTLTIWDVARIALDTVDAAGTRYLSKLVADPTIDGASSDLQAPDSGTPAILELRSIVVKPS